jgi:hypothetical protein
MSDLSFSVVDERDTLPLTSTEGLAAGENGSSSQPLLRAADDTRWRCRPELVIRWMRSRSTTLALG